MNQNNMASPKPVRPMRPDDGKESSLGPGGTRAESKEPCTGGDVSSDAPAAAGADINTDESTIKMVAKLRDIIAMSNGLLKEGGGEAPPPPVSVGTPVDLDWTTELTSSDEATKTDTKTPEFENESEQSLSAQKNTLISYIQDQIQNLSIRSNILRFKYDGYKKWFDVCSISILLLSASLTFVEAIRARLDSDASGGDDSGSDNFAHGTVMNMIPLAIGSILTILSALIKFKKYHVKMENIERAIQKAVYTTYRLKRTQENVKHLKTVVELNDALRVYSADPYDMYIQSCEEMENNLKYEDMVIHMQTYYDLSIE